MKDREFQAKIVIACVLIVFAMIIGLKIYNYVSE